MIIALPRRRGGDGVTLGQRLRAARKVKGLTQEQVSERIGWERPQLSHVERGRVLPSIELVAVLSQLYDLDKDDMLSLRWAELRDRNELREAKKRAAIVRAFEQPRQEEGSRTRKTGT
jgi:transcriptional regulator with XRE-family HTH domain